MIPWYSRGRGTTSFAKFVGESNQDDDHEAEGRKRRKRRERERERSRAGNERENKREKRTKAPGELRHESPNPMCDVRTGPINTRGVHLHGTFALFL